MKVVFFLVLSLIGTAIHASEGCHCVSYRSYCDEHGDLVSCEDYYDDNHTRMCGLSVVKEHADECSQPQPRESHDPSGNGGNG